MIFVGTQHERRLSNQGRDLQGRELFELYHYMTATSEKELIDFAREALNLLPGWMHRDAIGPYFLIAPHKRKLAIKRGAIQLTVKR